MKKITVLLTLLLGGSSFAQLTHYQHLPDQADGGPPLGSPTKPYGMAYINQVTSGGAPTTSGPGLTSMFVDRNSGSDSNPCNQVGAPCKTMVGLAAKLPKRVQGFIHVFVDGGVYPEGIGAFENITCEPSVDPDGGALILIDGMGAATIADAGSGLLASGTISSATADSNNTNAFITVAAPAGGYADGGLRGYFLTVSAGTPTVMSIDDNTSTKIYFGSRLGTVVPSGTFSIVVPGVFVDGGVTSAFNYQTATNRNITFSGPFPNFAAAMVDNVHGSPAAAGLSIGSGGSDSSSGAGGQVNACIIIQGIKATGTVTTFGTVTNSSDVMFRWNDFSGITGNGALSGTSGGYGAISVGGLVQNISASGNYANLPTNVAFLGVAAGSTGMLSLSGNTQDNGVSYIQAAYVLGPGEPSQVETPIKIYSFRDWIRGTTASGGGAIALQGSEDAQLIFDRIENAASNCVLVGGWGNDGNEATIGNLSIQGGIYSGCTGDAIHVIGNAQVLISSRSAVTAGTGNTGFGVNASNGARVTVSASPTVTGTSGDYTIDGSVASTWANLATITRKHNGQDGTTATFSSGGTPLIGSGGAIAYGFTDISGTPGSGSASTSCGRAAIASSASSLTLTNPLVSTTSRVTCQQESTGVGVTSVVCAPGNGSFVATSLAGLGVTTVTTGTDKFSWCVSN